VLGACIVLAVKFNEEPGHLNANQYRFYYDKEFQYAVGIPAKVLVEF
jgi:hypothetical protein